MPLGIVFLLALVALVFLKFHKRRTAFGLLFLSIFVLWIASTPFVAGFLYSKNESQFPAMATEHAPNGGCIIVLGGVLGAPIMPRVEVEMGETIDRVYKTAALYRAGKAPFVIVTGGNQPWSESTVAEADMIRDLLMEWGVPKKAIFLEGSSRNTRENALYSKNIIDATACKDPLLVTSAAHMPRAVAAFNSVGIDVTAVSTDVRVVSKAFPALVDFVPSAGALAMTSEAIREWIGQKVYAWQGWG